MLYKSMLLNPYRQTFLPFLLFIQQKSRKKGFTYTFSPLIRNPIHRVRIKKGYNDTCLPLILSFRQYIV